jgi:uncharacterized protein YjbI with pentapeptide repeats
MCKPTANASSTDMCSEVAGRSEDTLTPEEWVRDKIRSGEIADFNIKSQNTLDPTTSEGWDDERRISAGFLRKLFLEKANDISFEGVRIIGAFFPEGLTLEEGRLHRQLRLEQCRFEKPVVFQGLRVDGSLSLEGSFLTAQGDSAISLNLHLAKIAGQLVLDGATVTGHLYMSSLTVEADVFMQPTDQRPANFNSMDLGSAKIEGQLNLDGATVTGDLNMNSLTVGASVFMQATDQRPANFNSVDLSFASVLNQKFVISGLRTRHLVRFGATCDAACH